MARFAGRLYSPTRRHTHHTRSSTNQRSLVTHQFQVCNRWAWSSIMDTDPAAIAPFSWIFEFIYQTIVQFIYSVYIFLLKRWDRKVAESLELLRWLEEQTGKTFNSLEDVWTLGGQDICQMIQERTRVLGILKTINTMYSAQHLAVTQLGLPKIFNQQELLEQDLNQTLEIKLRKFLKNLKHSLDVLETFGETGYRVSEDIIARGVGLYAAYVGRRAVFSIYSKINGPLDGVLIEMQGSREPAILIIGGEHFDDDEIRLEYKRRKEKVLISYIVSEIGQYYLRISQNGFYVPGSPFEVHVEEPPRGYSGKFGAAEWYETEVKELPNIVDVNGKQLVLNRNLSEKSSYQLNCRKQSIFFEDEGPARKALPLLSPVTSPKTRKRPSFTGKKRVVRISNVARTLILARRFTTKLRTPIEINLENFHYFDNVDGLPSNSTKTSSDSTESETDDSSKPSDRQDKLVIDTAIPSIKLPASGPNWILDEAYKKSSSDIAASFSVWPSMTAFGPPSPNSSNEPNLDTDLIASNGTPSNNHITNPSSDIGEALKSTATYISPEGAAFPIAFNHREISPISSYRFTNETKDIPSVDKPENPNSIEDNSIQEKYPISKKYFRITHWAERSDVLVNTPSTTDNSLSLLDTSDRMGSSSSEDCYKMPTKERIIEVDVKAKYERTVFVPKIKENNNENDSIEESTEVTAETNTEPSNLAKFTENLASKNKSNTTDQLHKYSEKSKKRSISLMSYFDLKMNLREKYNLRRTQSAFSKLGTKSLNSAIGYLKSRRKVLIRIGEYAKESREVIKSSKSVKKWKNYWDGLQYERNVYTLRGKSCSIELDGIVAKGKDLFENIQNTQTEHHRAEPAHVEEVFSDDPDSKIPENSLVLHEMDPDRKERFLIAKNMFTSLENSSKRIYRSLPSKFKKKEHREKRKRINSESFTSNGSISERFHVIDLYKDIRDEGLGAPGIPHRLAVLASLRSVEPPQDTDLPGYSAYYPYLPTTPQHKYTHRSNMESLIPWGQIVKVN